MLDKKRDKKGRILRQGERQREDGRYEYRYKDIKGKTHSIYSWKLVETDKLPYGKRSAQPLRELEKQIQRDLQDGINDFTSHKTTLNSFFDAYMETKYELKQSTRTNYKYMYKKYVHDELGYKTLASIKYSDIKRFYIHLIKDIGFKPKSMEIVHTILHPVFTISVRDGLILINPTDGVMAEIRKSHDWETSKRHALTEKQQSAFIGYISKNAKYRRWQSVFTVLLGTGCRVGEFVGLRWEDCNFEENLISINHHLIYRQQDSGKCEYHITTTKSDAGTRIIPMLSEVKKAILREKSEQTITGFNKIEIDGYSGFIFQNRFGNCLNAHCINRAIERISKDYNKEETEAAAKEDREPELLPHFSAHNLRHTFCTRFCENETNLKIIQEIMGHADISTTMNIYNEATKEKKFESFANLEGKIKIS
ncbi:MAG: site-specific integrase [Clostridia bacterium]|nr:site-specific integrase [Clostridia bacterium]